MADPPKRTTTNGQSLVLLDPTNKEMTPEERQALSLEEFRGMEGEIKSECLSILGAALAFPEVDPADTSDSPPEKWVREFQRSMPYPAALKKAKEKLRVAKAAWLPTGDAPVGLKIAQATYIGLRRIEAADQLGANAPNVSTVVLVQAPEQYEVKELEGE